MMATKMKLPLETAPSLPPGALNAPKKNAVRSEHAREWMPLVDALGEFLLFLRREERLRKPKNRRRSGASGSTASRTTNEQRDRKNRILDWLRSLSESEWVSLCTVVDPGFVKTVLAMGMSSVTAEATTARRHGCAVMTTAMPQFQFTKIDTKATRKMEHSPREFLRRPVTCTSDGDSLTGFQSSECMAACRALVGSLRVVNTNRSCDTLMVSSKTGTRKEWLRWLDVIAGGELLTVKPVDRGAQRLVWEQSEWFASKSYFLLPELVVNLIEMNIWSYWSQAQINHPAVFRLPLRGVAAKQLLADEWKLSGEAQRTTALIRVITHVSKHVQNLGQNMLSKPIRFTGGVRSQLTLLEEIINAWFIKKPIVTGSMALAEAIFSQSVEDIWKAPQAAAVAFLIAELVQAECATLLSERLSKPETSDLLTLETEAKQTHAHRRRAARKKFLKQRKQDAQDKQVHRQLLRATLEEYLQVVKQREVALVCAVRETLDTLVDMVIENAGCEVGIAHSDLPNSIEWVYRPKRKKKRGKKKKSRHSKAITTRGHFAESESAVKENQFPSAVLFTPSVDDEYGKPAHDTGVDPNAIVRSDNQPFLGFLGTANNVDRSSRPVTPFGNHGFYSASNPFYLPLSSRESGSLHRQESGGHASVNEVLPEENIAPGPDKSNQSAAISSDSVETNFDWYLPSLFSSQSSVRTTSTVSSLDWDFQRWSLRNDNTSIDSAAYRPRLSHSAPGAVAPPRGERAHERPQPSTNALSLRPMATLLDIDGDISEKDDTESDSTGAVNGDGSDDGMNGSSSRSDFLYRAGGFFDRQRASKRRRRRFPFEFGEGSGNDSDEVRLTKEKTVPASPECDRSFEQSSASDDCGSMRAQSDEYSQPEFKRTESTESHSKWTDKISRLEGLLEETSKKFESVSVTMSTEISGLQHQVSSLTNRVHTLEAELEELKRPRAVDEYNNVGMDNGVLRDSDSSQIHSSSDMGPLHHSQQKSLAPEDDTHMLPHPMMHPTIHANSILGPFVSVPMSVLPPRSKLHWDMCEFVSQLQTECQTRLSAQMAAVRFCTGAVQSLWPRAQVRPYGSFATRLALPSSDVDLVICLPKVRRDAPADAAGVLEGRNAIKESWQQNLARKLRQEPWVMPDSVKTIPHAAIPIITLVTAPPYNVRLDISFEGPGHNGLATTDVVLSLIHEFPALAPIMLVLKSFVIERGFAVAYSGGLSSYALLLMVARYLQEHTDRMINGIDPTVTSGAQSCADFGMVLMGLLDFYGNRFDSRTTGISVASRCFLNRESIVAPPHHSEQISSTLSVGDDGEHWQMNQPSTTHNSNLLSSPGSRRYGNRTSLMDWPQRPQVVDTPHDPHKFDPIYIEDPLRPSNNVGRNCFRIMQIRRAFAAGHTTLMMASTSSAIFSANRNTRVSGVGLHPDNLLRAILGAQAPANLKSESVGVGVNPSNTRNGSRSSDDIAPLKGGRFHWQHPRAGPPIYDQRHTTVFGVPYYNGDAAPLPPYMLHRMQMQQHQQHQQTQPGIPPTAISSVAGSTPLRPTTNAYYPDPMSAAYRRHSESVTEKMTTRSEAASAGKYRKRKKDEALVSPRLVATMSQRNSVGSELDKADDFPVTTRKYPSRSMSFADVVIGGAMPDRSRRKTPSSPLALTRSTRSWREVTTMDERMGTKDDFEL